MTLHDFLIKNKVTSSEFARMIKTSRANIHNVRMNDCSPNIKTLYKIMLATSGQVGVFDLLREKDKNPIIEKVTILNKSK